MPFNPDQFREVIRCTLTDFDEKVVSTAAIELLMMTAAQESHLGSYLYQDDGDVHIETGLALGPMGIEKATYYDIVKRVIIPRYPSFATQTHVDLITDLRLSIIVARMKYWSFPEPLPSPDNVKGLARYYKQYYNTYKGKARIGDVIRNYETYCF